MNIRQYYEQHFGELHPNGANEVAVHCPFHEDSRASMSINLETGLWRCFGCDLSGDVYTFQMEQEGVDFKEAKHQLDKLGFHTDVDIEWDDIGEPHNTAKGKAKKQDAAISEDVVASLAENLWQNEAVLGFLRDKRGLSDETIHTYQLGYRNGRITIPVRDDEGVVRNIRQYSPTDKATGKVISWGQGFGSVRLFPSPASWDERPLLICEGEMDTLLARQLGFNAVTSTGGAGTWKTEWAGLFRGLTVAICYDVDDAGEKGAAIVARSLDGIAEEIRIVHLPLTEPKGADITNYIVDNGHSAADLQELLSRSQRYQSEPVVPRDETVHEVMLHQASKAQYYNKTVRMSAVVAGKDLAPYIIPSRVVFQCSMGKKMCELCRLGAAGGQMEFAIGERSPDLLLLKGIASYQQEQVLRRLANVNGQCAPKMEVADTLNIEELLLIPELEWSAESQQYVTRRCYITDHGLEAGKSYVFTGITIPEPTNQYATHLIYEKEYGQDDIGSFRIDKDVIEELSVFQPRDGQGVREKLNEIVADLSTNVTRIYGRDDLHIAIDLAYHSVLGFKLGPKLVRKGWLEVLLLGDTRTGKTETVQQLITHYQLGEFVTGESSSYAGLVGGLQQNQNRWSITWGKIPLNDRRLVVIDEASGLTQDNIANMSGIRSSGVAEITKIQTERAAARTRLIWISNPREGVPLNSRTYPVSFLRNLIGKTEDIARFDLVATAANGDVDPQVINSATHAKVPHVYTSEACHNLLMWVWSRTPDQVFFSKKALADIYSISVEMGMLYSTDIPLIEAADFRVKLARMAAAIAARLFSTDNGERLLVTSEHVMAARDLVNELYSKHTFKYLQYSQQRIQERDAVANNKEEIVSWLGEWHGLIEFLTLYDTFNKSDLGDYLGIAKEDVADIIKYMYAMRLVRRTSQGYLKKMPAFISLLEELAAGEEGGR